MRIAKLATLLLAGLCVKQLTAQPLFTYGTKPVTKEEFLRAFNKNPNQQNQQQAIKEYLPLYINYKLKVQDAYDKKMDTLPGQLAELNNFRRQLEENYVVEQANIDRLIEEAFERSHKDIHLGHLSVSFEPGNETSMKEAEDKINKAYAALKAKKAFAQVVESYDTDETNVKLKGDLGWITAFSLPYKYENAIYALPVGGYTAPLKGSNAFHIFKKESERKAVGKVKVAQILLADVTGQGGGAAGVAKLADSLYNLLQKGAPFDKLAQEFSLDKSSYMNGGQLPEFGVGSYDQSFENAAFSLQKVGDVSKPFQTAFGWHILKLVQKTPPATSLKDADAQAGFKQRVSADRRMDEARNNLAKTKLSKLGYKAGNYDKAKLWAYTDTALAGGKAENTGIKDQQVLFSYAKQNIRAQDWARFAQATRYGGNPAYASKTWPELMDQYINITAEEYYKAHLEEFDANFRSQLQEFKDANLLFEAMDKNVWSKAGEDSTGLQNYYSQHKSKYVWGPSAGALIITSLDSMATEELMRDIKADPAAWRKSVAAHEQKAIADSNRYELTQLPAPEGTKFVAGTMTQPLKNNQDGSQTFCYIFDVKQQPGQRSFEEARGFVINDYQQVLEERWLEQLKKKYPVKVNEAVWQTVAKFK